MNSTFIKIAIGVTLVFFGLKIIGSGVHDSMTFLLEKRELTRLLFEINRQDYEFIMTLEKYELTHFIDRMAILEMRNKFSIFTEKECELLVKYIVSNNITYNGSILLSTVPGIIIPQ
jgi:hypothetical protein